MCFNESASLFALAIGLTFTAILINHGKLAYAGLLFFISLMQLYEYFAHLSIRRKDPNLNFVAACLIYFGLVVQPLATAYFNAKFKPMDSEFTCPAYYRTWPFTVAYLIVVAWVGYKIRNCMKVSYVGTCGTICRLNWFPNAPFLPLLVFLLVFYGHYYVNSISYDGFIDPTRLMTYFLLASIVYTFFLNSSLKQKMGIFGSIWCFLAVFAGPMYLA